jgi:hypothetical protein
MKRINKVILMLGAMFFLASCEKKIVDLQPIDQIPSEKAIRTVSELTQAVNGVYGTWSARRSHYISALISDEVRLGTGTEYRNVGNILFNWQHVSDSQDWRNTETGGVWANLYQVIDRANRALEFGANVSTANTAEETLKAQLRGEMLAIRALAHLELLRNFSETPDYQADRKGVVLQVNYVKAPGTYRPSRNTQGEVMAQINKDLAEARNLIPASFTTISRITRNAVIGGQAKAALWSREWQTVVDRSSEVIASQPITPRSSYTFLWTTKTLAENQSTEVIWKLNVQQANLGFAVGSLWQDVGSGSVQATPAQKLLNTFDQANDIRWTAFFTLVGTRRLISKYGVVIGTNGENFQYDIKMMRTSDLLLARAEAYAELNQLANANTDLATLRTARITGYTHVALADKAGLIAAIITERYKELCFEGQRYYDLKRRRLPIERDLSDVAGNAAIQILQPTDAKYILPIPQQEFFANPNVGQNAGY